MRRWLVGCLVGFGLAAGLAACGGGPDPTKAHLRFVNASSGYGALDLLIDDARRFKAVGFGETEAYADVDPENMDSDVTLPDSSTALVSGTPAVKKKAYYTLLAWGTEGALKTVLLDENNPEEEGKVRLRVLNAAPDAGDVDVYLTGASDPLSSAVALYPSATVGSLSEFAIVAAASWRLRVTRAGDKTDLLLDASGLALTKDQVATLVITPTAGGVLVNGLLLTQEGTIATVAGAQARVRVAAPNSGNVTATVGGTVVMSAVDGPAIGRYELVPAGAQAVAVSVDGTALALADVTLAPGTDQTLLVWRQGAVPAVTWVADDNRLPTASGTAKLRLVHGLDGLAGALSLKVNFEPVASGVALGSASAYAAVTASANVRITATAPDGPIFDVVDQTLVPGGVYSVFVVEGVPPDGGVLRRDR